MKIAKESWIIAAIGVADLVTTIVFIRHHGAQEANPLFRHYWEMGVMAFIVAKMVCLLGPLMVLEWARKRNPRFVSGALRAAIVGYLGFYTVGYMQLNGPRAAAAEVGPQPGAVYAIYQERADQDGLFRPVGRRWHDACADAPCTRMDQRRRKAFYMAFQQALYPPIHLNPIHRNMWKFTLPRSVCAPTHAALHDRYAAPLDRAILTRIHNKLDD